VVLLRREKCKVSTSMVDPIFRASETSRRAARASAVRGADRTGFFVPTLGEFSVVCNPMKSRLATISLANSFGLLSPRAL
jgi:hypothetical protein